MDKSHNIHNWSSNRTSNSSVYQCNRRSRPPEQVQIGKCYYGTPKLQILYPQDSSNRSYYAELDVKTSADRKTSTHRRSYSKKFFDHSATPRAAHHRKNSDHRLHTLQYQEASRFNHLHDWPKMINILREQFPVQSEETRLTQSVCGQLERDLARKSNVKTTVSETQKTPTTAFVRSPSWNRQPREGCLLFRPESVSPYWKPVSSPATSVYGPCQCSDACCLRSGLQHQPLHGEESPHCTCIVGCTPLFKGTRPCPDCLKINLETTDVPQEYYGCPRVEFERPLDRGACDAPLLDAYRDLLTKNSPSKTRLTKQLKQAVQQSTPTPIYLHHVQHWPIPLFHPRPPPEKWSLYSTPSRAEEYSMKEGELIAPVQLPMMFPKHKVRLLPPGVDLPKPYERLHCLHSVPASFWDEWKK